LREKRVAVLPPAAYGGWKDVSEAWVSGVLAVEVAPAAVAAGGETRAVSAGLREVWAERVAIMTVDGHLPPADAERLAWEGVQHAAEPQ
jgi:hypothetical protein